MKLWILSDLHTEFAPFAVPRPLPDADKCVVAGDFGVGGVELALEWLHQHVAPAMPVLFVAGNHDYYRTSYLDALEDGRRLAASLDRVHFLENDTIVLGGVTFLGCTLWTDFALDGTQAFSMFEAKSGMNDYKRIKFSKKPYMRFTPHQTVRFHLDSLAFLERALAAAVGPKVVITHHAPSRLSLPERLRQDRFSPAYASNLDGLMLEHGPALWVHGHIHDPVDYVVGATRVFSNPRGYPGELPTEDFIRRSTFEL